jgi:phosphoglycolate phosphatase-like HAD superfamily hydrolase
MANDAVRPRLILWDIDHTLIETRGLGGKPARAAFEEATGRRVNRMADATGKTEPVILAETLKAQGIEPTEEYQRRFAQALPEQYRRHTDDLKQVGRPLPGAAEALVALRQVPGVVQTVLTGNYKAVGATKLAVFGLDGALDLDVGAYADDGTDRVALVSVAQKRASERYGHVFARDNTIVVGDTIHDVAAAHQGGSAIVAIASGTTSVDDLRESGADTVLPDLTDTSSIVRHVMNSLS